MMNDELAAYKAEVKTIEDGWYRELESDIDRWLEQGGPQGATGDKPRHPAMSRWVDDYWNGLEDIQERHGISWPDDDRAFSIDSFRREARAIVTRWNRDDRRRGDDPDYRPRHPPLRRAFDGANCVARHFPRYDANFPLSTWSKFDSLPKAWLFITTIIGDPSNPFATRIELPKGPGMQGITPKQCTEEVVSALLTCGVAWLPWPTGRRLDFTEEGHRESLRGIARRLRRDETTKDTGGLTPKYFRIWGRRATPSTPG